VTADQISLRDAAYYKEHMIEFALNKEVVLQISCFYFHLLYIISICHWLNFCDDFATRFCS